MASAASVAIPLMWASPVYAGAGGSSIFVTITEDSCNVCTGAFTVDTLTGAFVTLSTGDPANPVDQLNTANWADIYFLFGSGISTTAEIFSSDELGELALPQSAINEALALQSSSVTYEPDSFTIGPVAIPAGVALFEILTVSDVDSASVPEPGTLALLSSALIGFGVARRHRRS